MIVSDMNIRNIGDTLLKRLKSEAALAGISLREHVIAKLGGVQVVREVAPVREEKRRKPDSIGTGVGVCEHGCEPNGCPYVECRNFKRRL